MGYHVRISVKREVVKDAFVDIYAHERVFIYGLFVQAFPRSMMYRAEDRVARL